MAIHVGRRRFIATLGGAAAAWPLVAHAQQPDRVRRIGVLMGYAESDSDAQAWYAAFREGLQKLGWTERRNTQIDARWVTSDDAELMRSFAKELITLQPTSFSRSPHPPRTCCFNKRTPSPSFSRSLPTQSAAASSRT